MVVVVIYSCWLIGQSVVGRCGGKLPPFCRSRILVIFIARIMAAITGLGEVDVAIADLSLVRVPPLLSSFLPDDIAILIGGEGLLVQKIIVRGVEEHGKYRREDEWNGHTYLL